MRSALRSTSVDGSSKLIQEEMRRAAEAEATLAKEREQATKAAARSADAGPVNATGTGGESSPPRAATTPRGAALSEQQRQLDQQRAQYASGSGRKSAKLEALRSGALAATMSECDVCKKKMYPTDRINVDGFLMHAKPCGQCGRVGRDGTRCGNHAHRMVSNGGNPLPLCNVHYKQRVTEVGGHASPPRSIQRNKSITAQDEDAPKEATTLVARSSPTKRLPASNSPAQSHEAEARSSSSGTSTCSSRAPLAEAPSIKPRTVAQPAAPCATKSATTSASETLPTNEAPRAHAPVPAAVTTSDAASIAKATAAQPLPALADTPTHAGSAVSQAEASVTTYAFPLGQPIGVALTGDAAGRCLVSDVVSDSLAAKQGVRCGAVLYAVNGESTDGLSRDRILAMISAVQGTRHLTMVMKPLPPLTETPTAIPADSTGKSSAAAAHAASIPVAPSPAATSTQSTSIAALTASAAPAAAPPAVAPPASAPIATATPFVNAPLVTGASPSTAGAAASTTLLSTAPPSVTAPGAAATSGAAVATTSSTGTAAQTASAQTAETLPALATIDRPRSPSALARGSRKSDGQKGAGAAPEAVPAQPTALAPDAGTCMSAKTPTQSSTPAHAPASATSVSATATASAVAVYQTAKAELQGLGPPPSEESVHTMPVEVIQGDYERSKRTLAAVTPERGSRSGSDGPLASAADLPAMSAYQTAKEVADLKGGDVRGISGVVVGSDGQLSPSQVNLTAPNKIASRPGDAALTPEAIRKYKAAKAAMEGHNSLPDSPAPRSPEYEVPFTSAPISAPAQAHAMHTQAMAVGRQASGEDLAPAPAMAPADAAASPAAAASQSSAEVAVSLGVGTPQAGKASEKGQKPRSLRSRLNPFGNRKGT